MNYVHSYLYTQFKYLKIEHHVGQGAINSMMFRNVYINIGSFQGLILVLAIFLRPNPNINYLMKNNMNL